MSIHHLSFNNLCTNLTCCTDQGYIVYSINPTLEKKLLQEFDGGVGIMRIHKKSNIIILVGGGKHPFKSKDTLILWDQMSKQNLIEIDMRESIKNAIIVQDKIISVLENKILLFDWSGSLLDTKSTFPNHKGLCVINKNSDTIATLGIKKGEIAIWRYNNDIYKTINAHYSNIEAIAINDNGKLIATASETGTLIKVFNTETCKLEYELRRGSQSANVYDICFNKDSTLLACYSSNGTLHIFDLNSDINATKNTRSVLSGFKDYLPKWVDSQWGFRQLNTNNTTKAICIFDDQNDVHIATYDGQYYRVNGKDKEFKTINQGNLHINNK